LIKCDKSSEVKGSRWVQRYRWIHIGHIVPGRSGIEIHPANTPDELLGCIAPGLSAGQDRVNKSRAAMADLLGLIQAQIVNDMLMGLGPDLVVVNVQ